MIGINTQSADLMMYNDVMYDKKSTESISTLFETFMEDNHVYDEFKRALSLMRGETVMNYFILNKGYEYNIINSFSWEGASEEGFSIDFELLNDEWNDLLLYGDTVSGNIVYQIKKDGMPSNDILAKGLCTIGGAL